MQIDAHDAVGACGLEQVKHQTAGDGLAAAVLLILTGIAQQRADRGDGTRGSLRFNASVMMSCSMMAWLTGLEWLCIVRTRPRLAPGFGVAHVHFAVRKIVCGFQNINAELLATSAAKASGTLPVTRIRFLSGFSLDCAHRVSKRLFYQVDVTPY